jgi:hypothetical protein
MQPCSSHRQVERAGPRQRRHRHRCGGAGNQAETTTTPKQVNVRTIAQMKHDAWTKRLHARTICTRVG